jgi:hypothetical protein
MSAWSGWIRKKREATIAARTGRRKGRLRQRIPMSKAFAHKIRRFVR